MTITVYFNPDQVEESSLKGKIACVIDVLRASTTICTALSNGAREIIPVASVEYGMKIASNLFDGHILLGGERGGKRIQGFDLGNSPKEYSAEKVGGKSIVFATTNGTGAVVSAKYAEKTIIAGFVNLTAAVGFLTESGYEDVVLICSGREKQFSLEDALCAGALIEKLSDSETPVFLNDSARVALLVWQQERNNLRKVIRESDHGKSLRILGYESDIDTCTDIDKLPVVPVLTESSKLRLVPVTGSKN